MGTFFEAKMAHPYQKKYPSLLGLSMEVLYKSIQYFHGLRMHHMIYIYGSNLGLFTYQLKLV